LIFTLWTTAIEEQMPAVQGFNFQCCFFERRCISEMGEKRLQ